MRVNRDIWCDIQLWAGCSKDLHHDFYHLRPICLYGGYLEMAQKVIERDNDTCQHMHVTLRWLKIRTVQFLFNFSSKYPSRVKTLRWLTFFSSKTPRWLKIRREIGFEPKIIRILSHLRVFELKKCEPSQGFDTWWIFRAEIKEKLNSSNFEPSQSYMHMPSRVKTSFDDFLSHLKVPPVRKCWFSTKKFSKSPMQMRLYVNLLQC